MAEVQSSTESGQMAHQFIEMVMMQAQNAAFALGQIPHPDTGETPVNLDLARLFIDQLVMLRSKTRGNLSSEESGVLNNAISNLQIAFVEVSQKQASGRGTEGLDDMAADGGTESESENPLDTGSPRAEVPPVEQAPPSVPDEGDTKKKFSKSYGA